MDPITETRADCCDYDQGGREVNSSASHREWTQQLLLRGLFDPEWYYETYPDIRDSGMAPLEHYVRYGAQEGRSPCAEFAVDSVSLRYSISPTDALPRTLNEGLHRGWFLGRELPVHVDESLLAGWTELLGGEYPFSVPKAAQFAARLNSAAAARSALERDTSARIAALRITTRDTAALTLHAHFLDSWNDVAPMIRAASDAGIEVFVTATSAQAVATVARDLPMVDSDNFRLVPNQGRNFGPLLTELAKPLSAFEVVGHAHLKRSSHMKTDERDVWLSNLLGMFTPSDGLFSSVATLLENPDLGVLGRFDSRVLPYWANHWLKNSGLSHHLFPQVETEGFLEYPVGGFFWAKSEAIAPLLRHDWSLDDFPEEAGQLDGTMQHAVERLLGALPKALGFSVRISTDTGESVRDIVLREYLGQLNPHRLDALLARVNSVSLDFFDTLFYRLSEDVDHARRSVGQVLDGEGLISADDYVRLRGDVEHQLRVSLAEETDVTLDAVCRRLAEILGRPEQATRLAELECAAELHDLRPRPGMVKFVQGLLTQRKVHILSDTYYPGEFLREVMRRHQVPINRLSVQASADSGVRKDRDPNIWDRFESGPYHAHFGDNVVSDIQNVVARGIEAVHVAHPDDLHWMVTGDYPARYSGPIDPRVWSADRADPWLLGQGKSLAGVADV